MAVLTRRRLSFHPWPAMVGISLAVLGLGLMIASVFLPPDRMFPEPWAIEPLSYIGIAGVVFGLAICRERLRRLKHEAPPRQRPQRRG